MKFVLVLNSPEMQIDKLAQIAAQARVIAVDGGLRHLDQLGIAPEWIVGDLDSVTPDLLNRHKSSKLIKVPVEKDFTDLELALELVKRTSCKELIVFGVSGGLRFDHQLLNFRALLRYAGKGRRVRLVGRQNFVFSRRSQCLLSSRGRNFSVLAIDHPVVISINGSKYSGKRIRLLPDSGFGMGNRITEKMARIKVHSGFAAICQWEDEDEHQDSDN